MTARFIVADVFDGLATLEPGSVDLCLASPPFLAVRSYLPQDHPDKAREIGSERTPADYLDVLLDVVEACGRVLAPHGSLAFELGDTYSGSGGAGGDYDTKGLREGQPRWSGTGNRRSNDRLNHLGGNGWPLDKSLCHIPELFSASLAYGRNLLRPERTTPPWRVRTRKAWIRTNPPVGALGDKERPATSYITVATRARDRWFDLDAVRNPDGRPSHDAAPGGKAAAQDASLSFGAVRSGYHANGGAPPLDWWCRIDAVLDHELARRHGKPVSNRRTANSIESQARSGKSADRDGNWSELAEQNSNSGEGATGAHLRRALQAAGLLTLHEAIDQSPSGYSGAHYAVWPPELVAQLVEEMCPRQVCRQCGKPRRRITETLGYVDNEGRPASMDMNRARLGDPKARQFVPDGQDGSAHKLSRTVGWSDCGHSDYRPGLVLDPFVGSGTTLMVAHGHGRDAIGIDIDARNVELARGRLGMFLEEVG